MTSDRPYSEARDPDEACAELERCAGEQFDPEVVRLFVEEVRRRPPDEFDTVEAQPDPELEVHMGEGDFVLGAKSFAITDSLTLLYSHRHFHETARAEAQRAALQDVPYAIVALQLDELGQINRSRGFSAGDAALQSVAAVLQSCATRHQGLAFRVSGRRLALLISGIGEDEVDRIASELRNELNTGSRISVATAAWRRGEDSEQTIERVLQGLRGSAASAA